MLSKAEYLWQPVEIMPVSGETVYFLPAAAALDVEALLMGRYHTYNINAMAILVLVQSVSPLRYRKK